MSAEQSQLIAALFQENQALQKQVILCFAATLAEREVTPREHAVLRKALLDSTVAVDAVRERSDDWQAGVDIGAALAKDAERERILAILRAVSPNAGYDCKLLLAELIAAIEET